jgi:hypothetical protein
MELLWRERAAGRNDELAILSIDVGAFDRTIIEAWNTHIGPVDMTRSDVDDDTVGIGAVRRNDPAI